LLWLAASRSTAAAGELALAEVLEDLLARPALVAEYRRRAQAHVQAHYSWERVTDQYEALLKGCIHGRGKADPHAEARRTQRFFSKHQYSHA
jgi:hypothetical protein